MLWLGKAHKARRAITLAEVLGAMAITVAISGLLLGLFVDMRRNVSSLSARLHMQTSGEAIAEQIAGALRSAVRPGAFDVPIDMAPLFAPERCRVIASKPMRSAGFAIMTVEQSVATPKERAVPMGQVLLRQRRALAPGAKAEEAPAPATARILGPTHARFSSSVRFRYAAASDTAGAEPALRSELPEGEFPRLIEFRVEVTDLDGVHEPFACSTLLELLE